MNSIPNLPDKPKMPTEDNNKITTSVVYNLLALNFRQFGPCANKIFYIYQMPDVS